MKKLSYPFMSYYWDQSQIVDDKGPRKTKKRQDPPTRKYPLWNNIHFFETKTKWSDYGAVEEMETNFKKTEKDIL